jgi:very-short-patch-repair endonuclease
VTWEELRRLGLSDGAIERRVRRGTLWPKHPGVYAVGRPDLSDAGRAHAALLSAGVRGGLSHGSAVWGFGLSTAPDPHHVTLVRGSTKQLEGLRVHRVRNEVPFIVRNGLRMTTIERTLLDIAQTEPFTVLQRTLNEADYRRLVTVGSLDAFLADVRGHRGIGALRRAMLDQAPTRSHLEDRFYKLIREAGMPRPLVNHKVEGYECDFVWPQLRLIVETDGWTAHGTPRQKRRDRRKEARLQRAGWRVGRVLRRDLERPLELVVRLFTRT